MTDLVERLNTGLKLLDSKLHTLTSAADVAVALGLRDMLTETRNEIVSLRSQLAEESRRYMEQTAELVQLAEQRRVRLAEAEQERDILQDSLAGSLGTTDKLAARLAEAEALLQEALPECPNGLSSAPPQVEGRAGIAARIKSFLAADSAPAVGAARYRLQAKADPYKWADFDAKLWDLIVVPADQPEAAVK